VPVVQLQDDTGANLGTALGAAAGYFATQKQRKADKEAAAADKARTTAREDQAAADTHARIQSEIQKNNADLTDKTQQGVTAQKALGAYQANFPLLQSATVGPDGKKLTGQALANALYKLRNKALDEGAFSDPATHEKYAKDFNDEIARIVAANAPKISDVEHGLPQPVTSGKNAWSPQQMAQHYLADATTRVLNSDMPEDQKKLYIDNFQKIAEPYLKMVPKPEDASTAERRREFNLDHNPDGTPKKAPGEGRTPSATEQYFLKNGYMPPSYAEAHPKPAKPTPDQKPRPLTDNEDQAIRKEVKRDMEQPGADASTVAGQISTEWAMPLGQARVFVPGSSAPAAPAPAAPAAPAAPSSGGGGQKRTVSLQAAMALPTNKGKTAAQVQADIVAHGYSVVP
jgi:hypothetical protein